MVPNISTIAAIGILCVFIFKFLILPLFLCPLSRIPGPKIYALTKWRLAYEDWKGTRTRTILRLHQKHGPVVRVGPQEVSFSSLSALRTIYGAGSGFERTSFYDMFDVYGTKNLFTFHSVKQHADRKKLLAYAYSKSVMVKGRNASIVQSKVRDYLNFIETDRARAEEIFSGLHYFSIDTITEFLYGDFGKTECMRGNEIHRALLNDIMDLSRRKLSWYAVHLPTYTRWLYSRTGIPQSLARCLYPMAKPTTYTGIREHALNAWRCFRAAPEATKIKQDTIISKLWLHHKSQKAEGLSDLDIASECADHLLAGIDTTADALMFLIWALSRPQNQEFQRKLQEEVRRVRDSKNEMLDVHECDKLPYLNAVIMETLRLYAPLPASEPRSHPQDVTIDGFRIPRSTVVSVAPFTLHRNPEVFVNPLIFDPTRWLGQKGNLQELKKWFWAFSSGGRMCIGMHLAMAEMSTLVAAIYARYSTTLRKSMFNVAPGVTSRFEVFHDDLMERISEHECHIHFRKL
ncbi:uncharacterized protein PV09_02310 [Verruconis gallopava]|uniref:Benzoate 4-monooxygenase cytochrome P450 n=1 Tax=Verruconis gallopava TaxID=253628 RepID=A0A0D2B5T9_9PEZI|nr:uncharacterized protein PV09_02310 [Verruconis gallopava]KIW06594.1 hypothetical protein PV09_02310 [Verruconis gallopava]